MQVIGASHSFMTWRVLAMLSLVVLAGCAGTTAQSPRDRGYVEIANPAYTMSPNAPETIWVPRSYVEKGVPRGSELAKQGYDAVKEAVAPPTSHEPAMPQAAQAGIVGPGGKPAPIIPRFGLVVAVDAEKVYFNLGRETGIAPGQKLKVYRGGTVIEGLGLAPGECVGTVEVIGFVGTGGGYGIIRQGGPVRTNDLIGAE